MLTKTKRDYTVITQSILAKVEAERLQKAVNSLVSDAYTITVTEQNEMEVRGIVANDAGKQYGVVLTTDHAFCSCPDAMYRKNICKHAVLLVLHVIRTPQHETEEEARPVNLTLTKTRPGWTACA